MPGGLPTWKLNYQGCREKMEKINNLGIEKKFLSMIKFRRHKRMYKFGSKDQIFPQIESICGNWIELNQFLQIESKLKS